MTNITIRTNDEISEKISSLAKAMDRTKNWVIEDALKQYIAEQSWQIEGIKQAQESLAKGQGIAFNKVMQRLQSKISRKKKSG